MAQRTIILKLCDRGEAEHDGKNTVPISMGGQARELDLCPEHEAELRALLEPWLRDGRVLRSGPTPRRSTTGTRPVGAGKGEASTMDKEERMRIRAWAVGHGFPDIGSKGRISQEVYNAYAEHLVKEAKATERAASKAPTNGRSRRLVRA